MLFEIIPYEKAVYGRLEESVLEYMDEDMVEKFVPHIKEILHTELAARQKAAIQVESIVNTLFPGDDCASIEQQ